MAKKSDKFSPLLVVSGDQDLLRRRFVAEVVATQRAAGWEILELDGAVPGAVREALDGDMFTPRTTLAVVLNPEKVDLDLLVRHQQATDYLTTLLLHIEGEPDGRTKFGKAVKTLWAAVHKGFPVPPDWKAPAVAADFIQAEVKRHGLTLQAALATALVDRCGTDLGTLAFEVEKIGILAQLAGVQEIDAKHVRGGMAPIAAASVFPIVDALAVKNSKKLSKALNALRKTSKDDPTMRVSRLLATNVTRWLQATYLDALPPKAAAEELGVHPWVFETKVLPAAKRWGKQGAIQLVADLAASERAVLSGAVDPWTVLTTRLLWACAGANGGDPVGPVVFSVPVPVRSSPVPVVTLPEFVLPFDQAIRVPIQDIWVERAQQYLDECDSKKKDALATRQVRGGNPIEDDELLGKVAEAGVEWYIRTTHGLPEVEIDYEVRLRKVGWRPDLMYSALGLGLPDVHVKTSFEKNLGLPDKSITFQWSNEEGQWALDKARSWGGCDDVFTHRSSPDTGWRTHGEDDRFAIWGTSDHPDMVAGTWVDFVDGVPKDLVIYFLVPWKFLLETGQLQSPYRLKGHTKGCTLLRDVLAAWGKRQS